jgi:hypothetical protein
MIADGDGLGGCGERFESADFTSVYAAKVRDFCVGRRSAEVCLEFAGSVSDDADASAGVSGQGVSEAQFIENGTAYSGQGLLTSEGLVLVAVGNGMEERDPGSLS